MHRFKLYISSLAVITGLATISCNKDFLQRLPQTSITPEAFFNTPKDLETYTNSFYANAYYATDDINSDNVSSYSGAGEMDLMMEGRLDPVTVGNTGWNDWSSLRSYNFMLGNVYKTQGDPAAINHNIGIARFFRARFYAEKVARYSDVPWYSAALSNVDSALYKPRDPRARVVDSILADLQYAVDNIKPDLGNRTRVSKWTALALKARFCLFEGTFRKYHDELKLTDANRFLDSAARACHQIMNNSSFAVYNTGKNGADFQALFSSPTLAGNPEMIQWFDCQQSLGIGNNTHSVLGWMWSLSRSLMESYLMKDGTPFTSQPGYAAKGFVEVFKDRDPRLAETIAYPGFSTTNNNVLYLAKPNLGGYDQLKFYPRDPALRQGWGANYTGLPVYRFAEVLLNYAEAMAELGLLTQSDLDNSINKLRARVGMPNLSLAIANANPDATMAAAYPLVGGANKGVLLEIRRERRVEMACEGLRLNDVNRWAAGALLEKGQQGMYIPQLGGIDLSGDGIADIILLNNPADTTPIAGMPADLRGKLSRFYLKDKDGKDNNFYLENNTSGHILFTRNRDNQRSFVSPKYYYRPIQDAQRVLNPNLTQIFNW